MHLMEERSWWGWGRAEHALTDDDCRGLASALPSLAGDPLPIPRVADVSMRAPRITPPPSLAPLCSTEPADRAGHTYGKAYRDVIRALRGRLDHPPDVVARPVTEQDVIDLLAWADESGAAVIPYGGGSSVVGGIEYRGDEHGTAISLDLSAMNRVLEIDSVSQAAHIQAGVFGPHLEDQLRPHGLTLRHFPQSFEFSTLGGWLATRAGGHFATVETHIDDLTESIRAVTPTGVMASWRLPASGAGPSPDRLLLGSEGTLGVITEAWMRVRPRPSRRASGSVRFSHFTDGLSAVRTIAQCGLHPTNCRLLDPGEAKSSGVGDGGASVLLLGFESTGVPVDQRLAYAVELAIDHGGHADPPDGRKGSDAADAWRDAFLHMPYVRDGLARMGALVETFETAVTWDRIEGLYASARTEFLGAVEELCGAPAMLNCRLTHVYPDGAAPYFTVIAPGRPGEELQMWDEVKVLAGELLHAHGATITHHHAVGRDHRPWYDRQRPEPFAAAMRAVKRELDPNGILNPGVLIDP
ncbi:MAG: FAD-binding oxidoreductase [Solirubrobacteraceae bacterium]|nr:FAD-binding oxidoreductase [Solirubrobacteraceae bacterium]